MDIKYRILSVDEKEHSFVVRYYTDILTENSLTAFYNDDGSIKCGEDGTPDRCRSDYNLTMFDVYASHEDIERQIKMSAPAQWFAMLEHMQQNESTTALNILKEKLNKEHTFTHEPPPTYVPPIAKNDELTDDEVEALLRKITNV
jgi:hypothetical protein